MSISDLARGIGAWTTFLAVLLTGAAVSWQRPEWNFDLVGYVAVIEHRRHADPVEAHAATYAAIEAAAPEDEFEKLTDGSRYRRALFNRPECLATQVRLYGVKPAYLAAVAAVSGLGVNVARATYLVSVASYVVFGLGLRWWLGRALPAWMATVVGACLVTVSPVLLAGRTSAPDMLAALVVMPGLVCCASPRRVHLGMALLIAGILARPDVVILVALVLAWLVVRRPHAEVVTRADLVGFAVVTAGIYVGMSAVTDGYPYRVLLRHSLVAPLYEPGRAPAITFAEYLGGLRRGVLWNEFTAYPSPLPLYLLAAALGLWLSRGRAELASWRELVGVCWAYVAVHVLLDPVLSDRYFLPQFVFSVLALVRALPVDRGAPRAVSSAAGGIG